MDLDIITDRFFEEQGFLRATDEEYCYELRIELRPNPYNSVHIWNGTTVYYVIAD